MTEYRKNKTTGNHRWIAVLLAVLTVFSALPGRDFYISARAEEQSADQEESAEAALEGIRLEQTSLVMKTGEKKTLTASLLPAGTEAVSEITWTSSDEDIVTVEGNGTEAVLTAPKGVGGTAEVTASAGEFQAVCQILVILQEPMLEGIIFMPSSTGQNRYELTETEAESREYILRIPESVAAVYARAQLRDDVSDEAVITAYYENYKTGEQVSLELPADETRCLTSDNPGRLLKAYDLEPKDLTIQVDYKGEQEIHHIKVVRGTYVGSLTVRNERSETLTYTPAFTKTTFQYSVHVPASQKSLTIKAEGAEKTSTVVKVNGEPVSKYGTAKVALTPGKVPVTIEAGDGDKAMPYTYTLMVYVDEVCYLTVEKDPADAVFSIYGEDKERVEPEEDGRYELIKGQEYTYTISAEGYKSQTGSLTADGDQSKSFQLERAPSSVLENLNSQWSSFWKTDANQNILDAPTPVAASAVEVAWRKQYGTEMDINGSIGNGILVEDYICCVAGSTLLYLNRSNGSIVNGVQMEARGNSRICRPVYADGMIFVPLNNGMIQAFNAKTLDSLWVYTDTVGGNCLSELRYDSGYLYGSFQNGNLVCISAADEDPAKTKEAKNAVWRMYDSGGFAYTGVYTGETNLYACGGSGYLYCLNKKTGSVIQKFMLPDEAGKGCTAVCYADGRIYFGTSKGYLYSYPVQKDGKLNLEGGSRLKVGGTVYGTPLVYKNRIYLGTATEDRYGAVMRPYYIAVVQCSAEGELSPAYRMQVNGEPKGTPTMSTAYEAQDGYLYVYMTTDSENGEIYLLKDQAGAAEPVEGSGLLYQQNEVDGYGWSSILADEEGNLYFTYESAWIYALRSTDLYLEQVTVENEGAELDEGRNFDGQAERHRIVAVPGTGEVTMKFQTADGVQVSIGEQTGTTQTVPLENGKAEVTVMLSKGSAKRTYQFSIRCRDTDASLGRLRVSNSSNVNLMEMELQPAFDPEVTSYQSSLMQTDSVDVSSYSLWVELPENARSTYTVTAVSGLRNAASGSRLEVIHTAFEGIGEIDRYRVEVNSGDRGVVKITVTAEDGVTTRDYLVTLFRNNDLPRLYGSSLKLLERNEDSVKLQVHVNLDGYLYYLPGVTKIDPASEVRKTAKRIAVTAGDNVVMLEGVDSSADKICLYLMSYAQRFSTGVLYSVPAYDGSLTPGGAGDLNGDGVLNEIDVTLLMNAIAAEKEDTLSLETADIDGDGTITNADAYALWRKIKDKSS